ncbi:MAG: GNAT family N-acetyltransferase [Sedimenticola sp.]
MSWGSAFVALSKNTHERASFDCGEGALNTFIQTQAVRHMSAGVSNTMLLPAAQPVANGKYPICAFYTIAPGSISRDHLPREMARKLPHYPVPVFLLAQLAVHVDYQGQGLGKITLIKALENFAKINAHMQAYAVIVDCVNLDAERFYLQYNFQTLCLHEGRQRLFMPMKTVKRLFWE